MKKLRVGQSVVVEGTRIERLPNGDGLEPYRLRGHLQDGSTHEFAQSYLWFWARGLTPEPLLCSDCSTPDDVRVFPRRTAVFGEEPLCTKCKSTALAAAFAKPTPAP